MRSIQLLLTINQRVNAEVKDRLEYLLLGLMLKGIETVTQIVEHFRLKLLKAALLHESLLHHVIEVPQQNIL